jgi:hypothetical protein
MASLGPTSPASTTAARSAGCSENSSPVSEGRGARPLHPFGIRACSRAKTRTRPDGSDGRASSGAWACCPTARRDESVTLAGDFKAQGAISRAPRRHRSGRKRSGPPGKYTYTYCLSLLECAPAVTLTMRAAATEAVGCLTRARRKARARIRASPSARLDRSSPAQASGFQGFDARNRRDAPVLGVGALETKCPIASARSSRSDRSVSAGAPQALDGVGAIGPASAHGQLRARQRNSAVGGVSAPQAPLFGGRKDQEGLWRAQTLLIRIRSTGQRGAKPYRPGRAPLLAVASRRG